MIFVLKGPKWCKWVQMVPNGQKHVILTIWDHLVPFCATSGLWQACHVRPFLVPNWPFWMPGTLYRCLEMAKKGTSSIVLCMRKVLVRSVLVLCINVVIAPKKVTKKVKKWGKKAILWLFLSHRGCHMAPRLQKHEYLLVTKFWSEFEHFRMSGSIIC